MKRFQRVLASTAQQLPAAMAAGRSTGLLSAASLSGSSRLFAACGPAQPVSLSAALRSTRAAATLPTVGAMLQQPLTAERRAFSVRPASSAASGFGLGFLRSARVAVGGTAPALPLSMTEVLRAQWSARRHMSVRGKDKDGDGKPEEEEEGAGSKGEKEGEEEKGNKGNGGKKKKRQQKKQNSFADHIRGLKEDYAKFPDIYNSANGINFIIFTVFCLCSTGSNTEEQWWLEQWGLDNTFRPWTWFLHSFLTNNFLSMSFAMMLLHTLGHALLPTLGSHGLMMYVGSTAVISGAILWLGNRLYYGDQRAPEKQFGPWDVVHALFVMYYLHWAITPVSVLNSFNSWMKYAMWVGEVCILYFDWQPTLVGTLVGLALCKGVPRFRVKPVAAA